ncbi:MAG: hypothetical protein ABI767_16485 [Rhodanobacter sp.]
MSIKTHVLGLLALLLLLPAVRALATCRDTVVMVHGNTGSPADFQNTYNLLRQQGWSDAQIVAPSWGNTLCAACNDHNGSEETPVKNAISNAIASSCSGHIDVIGHSMGILWPCAKSTSSMSPARWTCSSASPAPCTACGLAACTPGT